MLLEQKLIKTDHYYTLENESMSNNNAMKGDNSNCIWIKRETLVDTHGDNEWKGQRRKDEGKGWRKRMKKKAKKKGEESEPKVRKRSLFWLICSASGLLLVFPLVFLKSQSCFWSSSSLPSFSWREAETLIQSPDHKFTHWHHFGGLSLIVITYSRVITSYIGRREIQTKFTSSST